MTKVLTQYSSVCIILEDSTIQVSTKNTFQSNSKIKIIFIKKTVEIQFKMMIRRLSQVSSKIQIANKKATILKTTTKQKFVAII